MRELWEQAEAQQRAGRLAEAAELYQQILATQPDQVPVLNNLGGLFEQLHRPAEALDCYRRAVSLAPDLAVPQFNLGDALRKADQLAESVVALRAAATLDPNLAEAWAALGATLLASGRPQAALGPLRRAVELQPEDDVSHHRLGDALQSVRQFAEAIPCYERAVGRNPRSLAAWYGLGHAQLERGRYADALAALQQCLALDPLFAPATHDLGKALFHLGCVERAMFLLRRAAEIGSDEVQTQAWENLALIVPGSPADDNRTVLETRRTWGQRLAGPLPPRPGPARSRQPGPLRIGYVSSFFHRPNWMKPVWGLINHHDRERFQIHLFSDAAAERIRSGYRPQPGDRFCDISRLANAAVAAAIAEQEVDILVDLNGYSAPRRLPLYALRPAPLVVGWFNLYATTGLDCFDYLIGDAHVIPEREEPFYTERIVRVPHSYLAFEIDYRVPDVAPAPVLETGRLTIGCLASQYKLTDQVLETWSEILHRSPGTRLLLRNATLGPAEQQAHLCDRLAAWGIPRERLWLQGGGEHFEFLETYAQIDFALDPFPYSGGTTTTEALWQGVPVVTFDGDRWASRTSVSLLRAAGLDEFVGGDRQAYIEICVRLTQAADTPARLQAFRAGIRQRLRNSPVCDVVALARSMESLYLNMRPHRSGFSA